jgi:hypothetical protein
MFSTDTTGERSALYNTNSDLDGKNQDRSRMTGDPETRPVREDDLNLRQPELSKVIAVGRK